MSGITSVLSFSALWRRLGLKRHNWPGRFTILLVANLVLLVSQPMLSTHVFAQILTTVTIALVLLAALYAFRLMRTYFIVALILISPAMGSRIALLFTPSPAIEMIGALSSCMFLAVTVFALVTRLFTVTTVTVETISAAICAYLLMGIAWAYGFAVLELRDPGAFSTMLFQRTVGHTAPLLASLHTFLYYSFVCLTTTGFGDISPVSEGARSLSVMEAVFGQLFMASFDRTAGRPASRSVHERREQGRGGLIHLFSSSRVEARRCTTPESSERSRSKPGAGLQPASRPTVQDRPLDRTTVAGWRRRSEGTPHFARSFLPSPECRQNVETGWWREVNSKCRYRFLNCQMTVLSFATSR